MSIFTNTLLYIISCDHHDHKTDEGKKVFGNLIANQRHQYSHLMQFFVIEHIVLLLFFLIRIIYHSKPKWVNIFHSRREYRLKANRWVALLEGMEDIKK